MPDGAEQTPEELQALQEELQRREAESQSQIPPPGEEAPQDSRAPVTTAFVIFQDRDGQWFASDDLAVLERIVPDRKAESHDFIPACSKIISDVTIMNTVQNTIVGVLQTSAQMAEQQRQQKMIEKLQGRGIHLNPRG